jgi:hypothetical protein
MIAKITNLGTTLLSSIGGLDAAKGKAKELSAFIMNRLTALNGGQRPQFKAANNLMTHSSILRLQVIAGMYNLAIKANELTLKAKELPLNSIISEYKNLAFAKGFATGEYVRGVKCGDIDEKTTTLQQFLSEMPNNIEYIDMARRHNHVLGQNETNFVNNMNIGKQNIDAISATINEVNASIATYEATIKKVEDEIAELKTKSTVNHQTVN